MKNDALFSSKDKGKKLKCRLLQAFVRCFKGERGGCDERFFICLRPVLQMRRGCKDNSGIIKQCLSILQLLQLYFNTPSYLELCGTSCIRLIDALNFVKFSALALLCDHAQTGEKDVPQNSCWITFQMLPQKNTAGMIWHLSTSQSFYVFVLLLQY